MSFENVTQRTSYKLYDLPTVEIKDYNVMIDGQNFFDKPIRNDLTTYGSIQKVATDHIDDYTIGCSVDYNYF